jgi:hypothetical protein
MAALAAVQKGFAGRPKTLDNRPNGNGLLNR